MDPFSDDEVAADSPAVKLTEQEVQSRRACKDCNHHFAVEYSAMSPFGARMTAVQDLCRASAETFIEWSAVYGRFDNVKYKRCEQVNPDGHCSNFLLREDILMLERLYEAEPEALRTGPPTANKPEEIKPIKVTCSKCRRPTLARRSAGGWVFGSHRKATGEFCDMTGRPATVYQYDQTASE